MATSPQEANKTREDLIWVDLRESSQRTSHSKGWSTYLVPIGCLATVTVLAKGLLNMYRRDSKNQQKFMRYRILAQGITIAIAVAGMFQIKR